jgi:hypothetical protein
LAHRLIPALRHHKGIEFELSWIPSLNLPAAIPYAFTAGVDTARGQIEINFNLTLAYFAPEQGWKWK